MNIIYKTGIIIFKIVAMFVILPALLLEKLSQTKHLKEDENEYRKDEMRKSLNTYPLPKHYGY